MSKSFTLIELLVALSIIVLLLAAAIPALRSFERSNELARAAEEVRQAIFEAKNYSLAPRSNKPADKDAYKFAWGIGGDALVYEIAELNTTPLPIIATQVVQYKLPTNINFSGTGEIYFSISQAGTIIFPNNDVTITVDQVQLRKRRTLTINRTTGRVDMSNETTY